MGNKVKDICKLCKMCNLNPENHWLDFPEGCLLHARNFVKREKDMEQVRRAKEELLECKVQKNSVQNKSQLIKIEAREKQLLIFINKFKEFGADAW